ncbi:conserved hypothetical protein [Mycoplasmoides gallisepticum str. F]|uniref:Uncharacterized protein n=1 Tax=Mycoplasmoides gallisepticum S6 TaxID=1006581 RepID=A0A0F6CKA7_MYCGL|nr:DUF5452 family protein [Mycoplasmoides gallisepticum]ADC31541.1 conserved hypothetical protein [Mycoplasmoides gallisepticum str. F]AHB99529.1 hypothetical protein GCW_01300 [Mycoplasmoides gallisepticum S6]
MNRIYKKITIGLLSSFLFFGTIGLAVATYFSSTKTTKKDEKNFDDKSISDPSADLQNDLLPSLKKYPLEYQVDSSKYYYYYVSIHQYLYKTSELDNLINYRDYLYQNNHDRPFSGFDLNLFKKNIKKWIYQAIRSTQMFRNNNDDIFIDVDYYIENPSRSISINVVWSFKKPTTYQNKTVKYWDQFVLKVRDKVFVNNE